MIEGVDYSRTAGPNSPSVASLKARGLAFVGRYAVNDHSPNGRGITADEYQRMTAGGIEVFLYWESSEGWMLGGNNAGIAAAVNAQQNINAAGMPSKTPVYFACDFDAAPSDQPALDDCLRGCAEVLGPERVGFYAGYYPLLRAKQNGTARFFCQTLAWSGGRLLDGVHLYQYGFNVYIDGTNCDLVRAYQPNYGQASLAVDVPQPLPEPVPQVPAAEPFDPDKFEHGLETGTDQYVGKQRYAYTDRIVTVRQGRSVPVYTRPGGKKVNTLTEGTKFRSAFIADIGGKEWLIDHAGYAMNRSGLTPKLVIPQPLR